MMFAGLVMQLILQYRYAFIFVGAPFLGPIVTLTAGTLVRLNTLDFLTVAIVLAASELSADILWYWLGYRYGERFVKRFGVYAGVTDKNITKVRHLYHKYHDSIILISKLTAGFGIAPAIFFTAGISRVPFSRYMIMNIVGQVIWTPLILVLGYYLGHFYLQANNWFDRMAYIGTAVLFIILFFGFGRWLFNRLSK